LGIGKSTVAREWARQSGAALISIDHLLEEEGLWESGRLSEFLKANAVAARRARPFLRDGTPVIFDGNFYWKSQLEDLVRQLKYRHYVVTLIAPLRVCIERDRRRASSHGAKAAREVYAKSTKFRYGIELDATVPLPVLVRQLANIVS
jgi:predicted kinase